MEEIIGILRELLFVLQDMKAVEACELKSLKFIPLVNYDNIRKLKQFGMDLNESINSLQAPELVFECKPCKRTFSTNGRLKQHTDGDHHKTTNNDSNAKRKFVCKIKTCRKQFSNQKLLDDHHENVHVREHELRDKRQPLPLRDFYCCRNCYKCFKVFKDFSDHQCSREYKSILSPELLEAHNRFTCGYCLEDLRQLKRIKFHLQDCTGGPFNCELCESSFDLRKSLIEHKITTHQGQFPFRCPRCPDKKFQLHNSLQKHIAQVHEKTEGTSGHKCDKCGKKFVKKVYLTNHQTRFHNLFKPYLCQDCGQRFTTNQGLARHMEIHKNAKAFVCDTCGKSFRRKDKLQFHQAVHTGYRPHSCDVCFKSFITKSKLQDHQRRHTGEKRFSCLVCNKMYSGSAELRLHLQRHHTSSSAKRTAEASLRCQDLAKDNETLILQSLSIGPNVVAAVNAVKGDDTSILGIEFQELTEACKSQLVSSDTVFGDVNII